jgi:hypothetical protein
MFDSTSRAAVLNELAVPHRGSIPASYMIKIRAVSSSLVPCAVVLETATVPPTAVRSYTEQMDNPPVCSPGSA